MNPKASYTTVSYSGCITYIVMNYTVLLQLPMLFVMNPCISLVNSQRRPCELPAPSCHRSSIHLLGGGSTEDPGRRLRAPVLLRQLVARDLEVGRPAAGPRHAAGPEGGQCAHLDPGAADRDVEDTDQDHSVFDQGNYAITCPDTREKLLTSETWLFIVAMARASTHQNMFSIAFFVGLPPGMSCHGSHY